MSLCLGFLKKEEPKKRDGGFGRIIITPDHVICRDTHARRERERESAFEASSSSSRPPKRGRKYTHTHTHTRTHTHKRKRSPVLLPFVLCVCTRLFLCARIFCVSRFVGEKRVKNWCAQKKKKSRKKRRAVVSREHLYARCFFLCETTLFIYVLTTMMMRR